jgi:hypothetical protein
VSCSDRPRSASARSRFQQRKNHAAALAQGRARIAACSWAGAAAFFVASLEDVHEAVAFAATAVLLSGALFLVYRRPVDRREEALRPGSVEELEARLAAADEGS